MPTLYDYAGRKVDTSTLRKELAEPSIMGVRTYWHTSVANALTPERLAAVISEVDQNDNLNFLTLANEMLERDLHFSSAVSSRINAVAGLKTMVEASSDDAKAVEIADYVQLAIDDDAYAPLIRRSLDGLTKGYSMCEIMWDYSEGNWMPSEYRWRDPRWFIFDRVNGETIRLLDEKNPSDGIDIEPYKFVYHKPELKTGLPIRCGLARLAAVAYMCKSFVWKDWLTFMEVFGMPLRVGKYNTAASAEQKSTLLNAVATIGTDAACIIPEDTMIEFVQAQKTAGGEDLFLKAAEFFDKQVSKAVVGQTASSEGTPGKLGADDAQENVRADIKIADAAQMSATLRRDLVKPLVDLNFGKQKRGQYPKLRIVVEEPEDLVSLSKSLPPFIDRGLKVQASVILDKFGLPEAEDDTELLQPESITSGGNPLTTEEPDETEGLQPGRGPNEEGEHGPPVGVPRSGRGPETDHKTPDHDGGFDETTVQHEQRLLALELRRLAQQGITLRSDQQALVDLFAQPQQQENDALDDLADEELDGWRRVMDPVINPILKLAKESKTYEEFSARLGQVLENMNSTEFMERLAVTTFKARGLGDATDEI